MPRRGAHTDHGVLRGQALPEQLRYPPAVMRHYRGPLAVVPGGLVVAERTALPESFRWHASALPDNARLRDRLARVPVAPITAGTELPTLEGTYFHFDYEQAGHYGHLMTEAISRFWGWEEALAYDPQVRLLLADNPRIPREGRVDPEFLAHLGVRPDQITWIDRPHRVTSLIGTTPLWHNALPFHVHPHLEETRARLTRGMLAASDGVEPVGEKIFVTRRTGNRLCRNAEVVEQIFVRHGFDVVFPGELSKPAQAALFAHARVVAGFGGTGLFNLMYAERAERLIVLNQASYDAKNEHLFAALLGIDLDIFWSKGDLEHPEDGVSYAARQSGWEFDLAANGDLDDVLARV